jgi:uncharacterized protein involved in cysteine biosynthesis
MVAGSSGGLLLPWALAAGIAMLAIIVVAILGMVWPRFLTWVANLVTIVAGTVVVFAIAFAASVGGQVATNWNKGLAAIVGDQGGPAPEQAILDRSKREK